MFENTINKFKVWPQLLHLVRANRDNRLLYFYEVISGKSIAKQTKSGVKNVPVSQIRGSMNASRTNDFDRNFRLRNNHNRARMANVAKAWQRKNLPPVALVQIGDLYFVQDGHHRVSIARSQKQEVIKANVTLVTLADSPSPAFTIAKATHH